MLSPKKWWEKSATYCLWKDTYVSSKTRETWKRGKHTSFRMWLSVEGQEAAGMDTLCLSLYNGYIFSDKYLERSIRWASEELREPLDFLDCPLGGAVQKRQRYRKWPTSGLSNIRSSGRAPRWSFLLCAQVCQRPVCGKYEVLLQISVLILIWRESIVSKTGRCVWFPMVLLTCHTKEWVQKGGGSVTQLLTFLLDCCF